MYDELNGFQKIELDLYILNSAVGSSKNEQHLDENVLDDIKEEIKINGRIRNNN